MDSQTALDAVEARFAGPMPSSGPQGAKDRRRQVVIGDPEALVALIDELLDRAGLSQRELCKRLGINESSFNQYRLRRRIRPSVWWLNRLALACGARIVVEWIDNQ